VSKISGPDRREHARIDARFIVSYRILEEENDIDITQTKNMGLGGMLLTTNRKFERGVHLALEIRLPFDSSPIMIIGKVIDSKEVTKNLIYDTRISFISVDKRHGEVISQTVDYYIKRRKK
jgi:hypothetical protein